MAESVGKRNKNKGRPKYRDPTPEDDQRICTCNAETCKSNDYFVPTHHDPRSPSAQFRYNPPTRDKDEVHEDTGLHEPLALAQALQSKIRRARTKPTDKQAGAIKAWSASRHEIEHRLSTSEELSKRHIQQDDVHKAMRILSKIFFMNSLRTAPVSLDNELTDASGHPLYGHTSAHDTIWSSHIPIQINSKYCLDPANQKHKASSPFLTICGALLHEMCHAFLHMYSCARADGWSVNNLERCPRSAVCAQYCNENIGKTGHGRAWHILVKEIEEVAPYVLGAHVKLWGEDDFYLALQNGWLPSDCDVANCFSSAAQVLVQQTLEKDIKNTQDFGTDVWDTYRTGETEEDEGLPQQELDDEEGEHNGEDNPDDDKDMDTDQPSSELEDEDTFMSGM